MKQLLLRAKAFHDSGAWLLILVGLLLFVARIPLTPGGILNFPVAATVFQTAGLMFTIAGLQLILSRIVWPSLSFSKLTEECMVNQNKAAGLILLGLLAYNGLSTIAFVLWLSSAMGAGLVGS